MTEAFYAILGSVIGIIITWVFNLVTTKMQHKMEIHRLAVQNKFEISKMAMGWLSDVKSELTVIIWSMENQDELSTRMLENTMERAQKLIELDREARKQYFNAIELYYNFDEIGEKYNLLQMTPDMLALQNIITKINENHQDIQADDGLIAAELLKMFKNLHGAVSEIMEVIRQDNLSYLK